MKAIAKTKRKRGLELINVSTPKIGLRDVLIKVTLASICGKDINILDWTQ